MLLLYNHHKVVFHIPKADITLAAFIVMPHFLRLRYLRRTTFTITVRRDLLVKQRLLDHLEEAGYYSEKDLQSLGETMEKMHMIVERGKDTYSPGLVTLLIARLHTCDTLLEQRRKKLAVLSPELSPIYEKLISILRTMSAANTKQKVTLLVTHYEDVA